MALSADTIMRAAIATAFHLRARRDEDFMKQLVLAYKDAWESLQPQWDVIQAGIEAGQDKAWLEARVTAYQLQLEEELTRYSTYLDTATRREVMDRLGTLNEGNLRLISAMYSKLPPQAILTLFHRISEPQLVAALGLTSPPSPLYHILSESYGATVAKRVGTLIRRGIILGWHPTKLQDAIDHELGTALQWSLSSSRTVINQIEWRATSMLYQRNTHLLSGWIWTAALDDNTCLACSLMSGTWHPPEETLDDHYNGRCMMIPAPRTYRSLGLNVPGPPPPVSSSGIDWLMNMDYDRLQKFLGPSRFDLFLSGRVHLSDFVTYRDDPVYGRMLRLRPLRDFIDTGKQYLETRGNTPVYLTIQALRHEMVNAPVEWGAIIDPRTGHVIDKWTDGEEYHLQLGDRDTTGMIHLHNHPPGGIAPFSEQDILFSSAQRPLEEWALSSRGDSRLTAPAGWPPPDPVQIRHDFEALYLDVINEMTLNIDDRQHLSETWDTVFLRALTRYAEQKGLHYDWIPR